VMFSVSVRVLIVIPFLFRVRLWFQRVELRILDTVRLA
jgi:hypothetical protein